MSLENNTQVPETTVNPEVNANPTPAEAVKQPEVKTFTQDELDRILADRIARERKKFEGFDDIKRKADEYEKALEERRLAELSAQERADELRKKAEEEKSGLARQLDELQAQIKTEKIRNAFITAASNANIAYVDDAYRLADLSAVEIGEDGKVNGVDDVVKALVEHKPFLIGGTPQPKQIGQPTANTVNPQKTAEQQLAEAAAKAKKSGRAEDLAEYSLLKRKLGL